MNSTPSNPAAFPQSVAFTPCGQPKLASEIYCNADGMTLRDWFAGQALAGELASASTVESIEATAKAAVAAGRSAEQQVAYNCYAIADAMLIAREANTPRQ